MKKRRKKILVFANQKGGVGKTTICTLFANWLAKKGLSVDVVDADKQRTLSIKRSSDRKVYRKENGEKFDYDVVTLDIKDQDSVINMMNVIESDRYKKDVVLFDTPGNLTDDAMINILAGADYILCPLTYDQNSLSSTGIFISVLDDIRKELNIDNYTFFVPTNLDKRTGTASEKEIWAKTNEILEKYGSVAPVIERRQCLTRFDTVVINSDQIKAVNECFEYLFKKIFITDVPEFKS